MAHSQTVFPPQVLSRIAPDILLQRHLAEGIRPSLREFDQFRSFDSTPGTFNDLGTNSVIGLATVRNGDAFAFCGITLGVVETSKSPEFFESDKEEQEFASIFPVVEITRGRTGAPTDEEMILSQTLYDTIFHLKLIPLLLLLVSPGYQISEEDSKLTILYSEDIDGNEDSDFIQRLNLTKKNFRYVLYAHIKVFSRSGPLFDLIHYATVEALKNVLLPRLYLADSGIDPNVRIPVRSRGNFGHLTQAEDRFFVDNRKELALPLVLSLKKPISSSFGVVEYENSHASQTILLADVEGEAEEHCAESRINVIACGEKLTHVSVIGGGANVSLDTIQAAFNQASHRSVA